MGMAAPNFAAPPPSPPERRVRRRHVLYLSGFDPQGPAHYHALYRDQAALQAQASGDHITVGPRQRTGDNAAWDVQWQAAASGDVVETRYEFLRWDDIVRAHWPRGQVKLLGVTLATTWRMVSNGSLWRIWQTSWPAFLALALPAALVVAVALAAVGLAAASWWLAVATGQGPAVGVAALAIGGALLAWGAVRAQRQVQMAWLMRSASAILQQARGELPELEQRLDAFAARLCDVARQPHIDELLVVGHSSGAMLAASVVARALARHPALSEPGSPLSLLTLGECVPVLSYQPEAKPFRQELARLRAATGLAWVDVTAPPDGCCFALVDPTAVCEDGLPEADRTGSGPKRVSPRFSQRFAPQRWRAIRRDKYRCHFQYLMAVELPGGYDYFAISAGGQRLAQCFAQQAGVTTFANFQCWGGPRR